LANDNVRYANGAVAAAKAGNGRALVENVAPMVGEVALGPGGIAAKVAKDKLTAVAISQAPPEHQEALRRIAGATSGHPLTGLVVEQLTKPGTVVIPFTGARPPIGTVQTNHTALNAAEQARLHSANSDAIGTATKYLKSLWPSSDPKPEKK
jgi:hypothetical protein